MGNKAERRASELLETLRACWPEIIAERDRALFDALRGELAESSIVAVRGRVVFLDAGSPGRDHRTRAVLDAVLAPRSGDEQTPAATATGV